MYLNENFSFIVVKFETFWQKNLSEYIERKIKD